MQEPFLLPIPRPCLAVQSLVQSKNGMCLPLAVPSRRPRSSACRLYGAVRVRSLAGWYSAKRYTDFLFNTESGDLSRRIRKRGSLLAVLQARGPICQERDLENPLGAVSESWYERALPLVAQPEHHRHEHPLDTPDQPQNEGPSGADSATMARFRFLRFPPGYGCAHLSPARTETIGRPKALALFCHADPARTRLNRIAKECRGFVGR